MGGVVKKATSVATSLAGPGGLLSNPFTSIATTLLGEVLKPDAPKAPAPVQAPQPPKAQEAPGVEQTAAEAKADAKSEATRARNIRRQSASSQQSLTGLTADKKDSIKKKTLLGG